MPGVEQEPKKQYGQLKKLMIGDDNLQLTRADGRTWLTDRIVLLDVSEFPVVAEVEDGWYRIVTTRGFVQKESGLRMNVPLQLEEVSRPVFHPVRPTEWSLTDNPPKEWNLTTNASKAFLLFIDTGISRIPLAMNEYIWRAFLSVWPSASLSHSGHTGPFRVATPGRPELAYIGQIVIPEHLQDGAQRLVDAYLPPAA